MEKRVRFVPFLDDDDDDNDDDRGLFVHSTNASEDADSRFQREFMGGGGGGGGGGALSVLAEVGTTRLTASREEEKAKLGEENTV